MLRRVPTFFAICGRSSRVSSLILKTHLQKLTFNISSSTFSTKGDKDLPANSQPPSVSKGYSPDTDLLYGQLKKAQTVPRLLELTSQHLNVMNNKHIVAAFEVIHENASQRGPLQGKSEVVSSLPENEIFQDLCNHTLNRIRFMDYGEVITVFKTLSLLGIQNNTFIMQALLKMVCSQVNQLNLTDLSFLNFLLSRQKSSPAVDGLKMALPLVLQVQIENQLDSENVSEVVNCLKICSQARVKSSTIQKIITALLRKKSVLTGDQAITVIFSLLSLETPVDGYLELLNNVFHIAANNIETLRTNQILHCVRLCNRFNFFHPSFLVSSAKKAVSEKWNLMDCMELQKYLHKLHIFHQDLLDLLCEGIISNAEIVRNDPKFSPLLLATYFALTTYHSPGLENALEILCSSEEKLCEIYDTAPHFYTRFVCCLSVLGFFPARIFQFTLSESFMQAAWSASRKNGRIAEFEKSLCTLMWAIEAHGKGQSLSIPETVKKQVVQSVTSKHMQSSDYPLTKFLENGLGGSQFFCTGIFSRSGHVIDHVVAMRNGNYPVSLSSINKELSGLSPLQQVTYIEDLCAPSDSKILAIIVARESAYCSEPAVLKSWEKMKIDSLSRMNYCPVVINYPNWCTLPDREKIPFLMREIKQAAEAETFVVGDQSTVETL